jgi:hypothetical protein
VRGPDEVLAELLGRLEGLGIAPLGAAGRAAVLVERRVHLTSA